MRALLSVSLFALGSASEHALRGPALSSYKEGNKTLRAGRDYFVFTISIESAPNFCLNVNDGKGDDGTGLVAWECTGDESQLWFFDEGSYRIQWAGDASKCVDAGSDMAQGNQLMLWDCNGLDQQTWGYDGSIYLNVDNPSCMDLYGGDTELGTPVVLWDCLGLWSQTWTLSPGITIRTHENPEICLDLAGGSTDNGTPIQLWECTGEWMQKWILEDWRIKLAADHTKCIDAGDLTAGNALILWDCLDVDQQMWGYADGTLFLSSSSTDASLCMDLPGGSLDKGTQFEVWDCNGCWNQVFDVVGPASEMDLRQAPHTRVSSVRNLTVGDSCPDVPAPPSPSPPTPAQPTGSHCIQGTDGDQHGWPVFEDQASLQASNWAGYFQDVYGEVPQTGYPICVYNFWWLFKDVKRNHGCDENGKSPRECPHQEGAYYWNNNAFDRRIKNSAWIYHKPPYSGIAENTWAEVIHSEGWTAAGEGHGIWFFYSEGAGIWYWIGKTMVFPDHAQAGLALCGHWVSPSNFDGSIKCAQDKGLNSIQFTNRRDPEFLPCSPGMAARNIEIVGTVTPSGEFLTGAKPCGNDSGKGVFKAGWEASQDCSCDNSVRHANCRLGPGYPPL